jgi:hypothetical protein
MAKKPTGTAALLKKRLDEVGAEKARREKALASLQDKLRADPYDAELRAKVQRAKEPLIALSDEHGELARAVSAASGGKSFSPLPG